MRTAQRSWISECQRRSHLATSVTRRIGNFIPKPQSTPAQYAINPLSSSITLCSLPPTINFRSMTTFVRLLASFDMRNKWGKHIAYNPDLAVHTSPRSAACAISTAREYHPIVWSNFSSGIGSASIPASCNTRSCPASALRFDVWSNSRTGIASNTHSGAASCCRSRTPQLTTWSS